MRQSKRRELLDDLHQQLKVNYPSLHLIASDSFGTIQGLFPVKYEGAEIDRFLIEIALPQDFPKAVPIVYEMGGRIPRIVDRHTYEGGALCLFLPEERWRYWPEGSSFLCFLTGPVNDFFLSQIYFERTGEWPFGERRHGALGILDYYVEELGTDDLRIIAKCLQYLSAPQPKGHWPCFCRSGRKLRHCHFDKMSELHRKIQPMVAARSLVYIEKLIAHPATIPYRVMSQKSQHVRK